MIPDPTREAPDVIPGTRTTRSGRSWFPSVQAVALRSGCLGLVQTPQGQVPVPEAIRASPNCCVVGHGPVATRGFLNGCRPTWGL